MGKAYTPNIQSDKGKNLTKYVAQFVKKNKFNSIPKNVVELAKKHILDGFGLALSGSVARTGDYLFKHIKQKNRFGVNGEPYIEKTYSVLKGSQRVTQAKKLGYTHIEALIKNAS